MNEPKNKPPTRIQITDQLGLGADANNWYITKKKIVKGEVRHEQYRWYGTLTQAARFLVEHATRTSGATTAQELLDAQNRFNAPVPEVASDEQKTSQ